MSASAYEKLAQGVGAELKRARLAAGLTQEQLAERTGQYRPIVGRIESGRHLPQIDTILTLIKEGIPVDVAHIGRLCDDYGRTVIAIEASRQRDAARIEALAARTAPVPPPPLREHPWNRAFKSLPRDPSLRGKDGR